MGAIQIKNVPEDLHDAIRSRAAAKGKTVSDYMLDLAKRDLAKPTVQEWVARVRSREPVGGDFDTAELIRQNRKERTDQILRAVGFASLPDPDDDRE
jgi:plasmid stability protein